MTWAGTTIRDGLPMRGRRVPSVWVDDESFLWYDYDDDYDPE